MKFPRKELSNNVTATTNGHEVILRFNDQFISLTDAALVELVAYQKALAEKRAEHTKQLLSLLVPGCWVHVQHYGEAVFIQQRGNKFLIRYEANCTCDAGDGTCWVWRECFPVDLEYVSAPDARGLEVLNLRDPGTLTENEEEVLYWS